MEKVKLRDVAKAANCSVATVSRVFSGSRPVGPDVARHVLQVGKELGYRPDRVGRALRSGLTGTVGVVVPQITNPFFAQLVRELERAFSIRGQSILFADCDDDPQAEAARLDMLLDRRVDGLVIVPSNVQESRAAVNRAAKAIPVVQMDRIAQGTDVDYVGVDNRSGMQSIINHLKSAGCSEMAFVGGSLSVSSNSERLTAYLEAAAPLASSGQARVHLGDLSLEWGREAASRIVTQGELPDAVICANDLVALGVVQTLHRKGIQIPSGVAVTGFDDTDFASVCDPPLTTCRQPSQAMAEEVVRLMTSNANGPDGRAACQIRLSPELITRESTKFTTLGD